MEQKYPTRPSELDELLTVLADQYRRAVLSYFQNTSEEVATIDTLASEISDGNHEDTERVTMRLYHSTLPRLESANVIDYDERDKTVQYHGHVELETLLGTITGS